MFLDDVFITTKATSDPAVAHVKAEVRNRQWTWQEGQGTDHQQFQGKLTVQAYPWFPEEGREPAASMTLPVRLRFGEPKAGRHFTFATPSTSGLPKPNRSRSLVGR